MTNPNPSRITAAMWRLWTNRPVSAWLLGGIYANKSGYHNTRAANQTHWSGNYSVRLALDLQGPSDKAAAIDYTMSDAEMRRRTAYLRDAADRRDPRLYAVREFYGTLNSSTVFGRSKDSRTGPWRSSTSDSSHLWHIHISFFRAYVDRWDEVGPVLSVLSGETLARWQTRQGGAVTVPSGTPPLRVTTPMTHEVRVVQLQRALNELGEELTVDGWFGSDTAAAVGRFQRYAGLTADRVYGPDTEAALHEELTMDAKDFWQGDYRIELPDFVLREWPDITPAWWPRSLLRSGYGHARRASERSGRLLEVCEAILAAVSGEDTAGIMARVDAHHAEQMAAMVAGQEQAAARDAELLELVRKGKSGELTAEQVVDEIAQRLVGASERARDD